MKKPPTQVTGVSGIAPEPIREDPVQTPTTNINWSAVVSLPPFQMFAAEKMRNTSGKDSQEHAADYVRQQGAGPDVLQAYSEWHTAKGYWKNETPLGEMKSA